MRAFACGNCRGLVFFENSICITCGRALGYDRGTAELVVLRDDGDGLRYGPLRPCANLYLAGCNWLAEEFAPGGLCSCCALTRVRPGDHDEPGLAAFARAEAAKRRLLFQLDALGLSTTPRTEDPDHGLAFDLLSSTDGPVTTGHDRGVITIDLAEGEDQHREAVRVRLAEPYRTLLGHLRHEIGHWYWEILIDGSPFADRFRDLFGDPNLDYSTALETYYAKPVTDEWTIGYVSHYASAHPWEDWAETFAHYLHIRDTLQTAAAWGIEVGGPDLELSVAWDAQLSALPSEDLDEFVEVVRTWLPLTYALNAVNRSMGHDDLYPFVLPPRVLDKLRFVHVVAMTRGLERIDRP